MPLRLSYGEASAAGPRPENQDALRVVTPAPALATGKGYLFALADGVSQCADGGLAARATLQALAFDYYATPETWAVAQSLDRVLVAHNRWLQANGGNQPLLTTLTALVLRGRRFTLAHVGDCRAYRWNGTELERLSEDHVWEQSGMQHVLKRALGLDQHLVMDYLDGELQEGESYLLLSDGVWSCVPERDIAHILHDQPDLGAAARALVNLAHQSGSQDNASALLLRVDALPEAVLADTLAQLDHWPLPPKLRAGQTFEGWQVTALLHESRQSLIYRVLDGQGQPWLLKTLPPSRQDELDAGPALLQEEWFMRRVAGRHFAELHPLPQRQHLYYVQREYPGCTLAQRFAEEGPLPLADLLQIAPRLIRAVGMLHRRNILHRDIKPENLLLGEDGRALPLRRDRGVSASTIRPADGSQPLSPRPAELAGGKPEPRGGGRSTPALRNRRAVVAGTGTGRTAQRQSATPPAARTRAAEGLARHGTAVAAAQPVAGRTADEERLIQRRVIRP